MAKAKPNTNRYQVVENLIDNIYMAGGNMKKYLIPIILALLVGLCLIMASPVGAEVSTGVYGYGM